MTKRLLSGFGLCICCPMIEAAEPPQWMTEGPYVDDGPLSVELPFDVIANKLLVEVEIGGVSKPFVYDTGSPSMVSSDLARELGLKIIDKTQGRDAHGTIVDTEIAQTKLTLGGTTFRKVPVFVADFSTSKAHCLWDGVLGSELLPLCAWQIDLPDSMLRCNSDTKKLDHLKGAKKQPLHDFGYPHTPFLDVQLAKNATSKAMLDTGFAGYFTISQPDFDGANRNAGVGKITMGRGSPGTSLGGQAPIRTQTRTVLKDLSIGNVRLGRVGAAVREAPPSLVGTSILEHFVVTFDAGSGLAYFDRYRKGPFDRPSFGFNLGFDDDAATVSLVWEGSPAAKAGLKVGQRITSINGRPAATSCDGFRHALQAISQRDVIALEWDGGGDVLTSESTLEDD